MTKQQRQKEERETKLIALERIEILLTKADSIYHKDAQLAQKYGDKARNIAMKAKVKFPKKWSFRFCRSCKKFLYPGINAHVRIKSGKPSRTVIYCELCHSGFRAIVLPKKE